jgi:hypothetical protein
VLKRYLLFFVDTLCLDLNDSKKNTYKFLIISPYLIPKMVIDDERTRTAAAAAAAAANTIVDIVIDILNIANLDLSQQYMKGSVTLLFISLLFIRSSYCNRTQ